MPPRARGAPEVGYPVVQSFSGSAATSLRGTRDKVGRGERAAARLEADEFWPPEPLLPPLSHHHPFRQLPKSPPLLSAPRQPPEPLRTRRSTPTAHPPTRKFRQTAAAVTDEPARRESSGAWRRSCPHPPRRGHHGSGAGCA